MPQACTARRRGSMPLWLKPCRKHDIVSPPHLPKAYALTRPQKHGVTCHVDSRRLLSQLLAEQHVTAPWTP